jgi:hypothetical protein
LFFWLVKTVFGELVTPEAVFLKPKEEIVIDELKTS